MIEATKRWLRVALGWCLVIAGIILIPLPGPGLPVIFGGLVVLSRDSAWARRMVERMKEYWRSKRERRIGCERKSSPSSP
ncbi:MAG: PGPGW domain-containing protein [Elusimicrobia bacterium]|nr:PGPGW domain-containing protein [Elusimicrobiota bacterium]